MFKNKAIIFLSCLALLLSAKQLIAEAEEKNKELQWGILPIALPFYMPETNWGLGYSILYFYKEKNQEIKKPNEVSLYGAITLNKQFSIGLSADMFLLGDYLKTNSAIEYSYFPDYFWGVGDNTQENGKEKFTEKTYHFRGSLLAKILPNLYAGPHYKLLFDQVPDKTADGILSSSQIRGSDGTVISGPGLEANYDSRDNGFYPTKGLYMNFRGYVSHKAFGSEYNFTKMELDTRFFLAMNHENILAFQLFYENAAMDAPFQALSRLGGDMMMRGYYQGRYRDKNYLAFQTEYRYPVYKSFSGVLFGGAAQVAGRIDQMNFAPEDLKYSWGAGLRYNVEEKEHINFRLDMGMDRDKNINFYFMIKDAF